MGCCKKKKVKGRKSQAASSLAPSDKYHKNPQGGHRHTTASTNGGGGETGNTTTSISNHPASANNNHNFSHNGIPPPISSSSSSGAAAENLQQSQLHDDQLIQSSSYHFYPSNSLGSSSISSSSHHHLNNHHLQQQQQPLLPPHQPPYLYKSNQSSSGGSSNSGNGSHIIIDGSNNSNGVGTAPAHASVVEGSNNKKYYYYYNGYYYPTTVAEEEDPEQIFTITAFTSGSGSGREIIMGRVGEDMYPPGSPASIGKGGGGGSSGLFKSKSSSIPVTGGSPTPHHNHHHRGFRDTFISSMSPPVQVHSAESSPLHRSASAATANSSDRYSASGNNSVSGSNKQENKKWSFGGLFRRNKQKAATAAGNNNSIVVVENGASSSANNSHCNSPAKVNNNYGGGSPIIIPNRASYSPAAARPASSVGFFSVDPNVGGQSENFHHHHRPNTIISSAGTPKFVNAESQTRAKGKLSESDISTCDSDLELELPHHHDNPPEPAPQENKGYKQNFLVRRLSRRKEKAAAKKAAAAASSVVQQSASCSASPKTSGASGSHLRQLDHNSSNGFISSQQQQHGGLDVPQMKRRVGSSPDSLNNSSEPWPSWETTKKPQSQLQALQQQHQHLLQNYSSNGSLSVSQEGYNSNNNSSTNQGGSKSSRAAAREAVKARAIARRESFLNDSSTSDEEDTEERGSQRSSLQGSFSSLNSRNRRQRAFNMQQAQFQQQRHLFPATTQAAGGISCASPSSPMPVPLDYRNSTGGGAGMSPNMNRRLMMMGAPGSPKWEARVIYQQQDGGATAAPPTSESASNQPVVVRLPRKERMNSGGGSGGAGNPSQMSQNNGDQGFIMATEMISEDQHVVTAGLKVPFLAVQNQQLQHQEQQQQCLRNGQLMFPDDPVQYANVANGMRGRSCTPYMGYNNGVAGGAIHHASPTPPPPPPPRRDFTTATNNPNFYRPVSCSYLDSYANQLQQMSEQQLQMRQQSPMVFNGNYVYTPTPQHHHQYQGQEIGMNGFASHSQNPVHNVPGSGIARSSPRHFVHATTAPGNNNQPDTVDGAPARHPPLIRSPSEPPIIRASISSPVKRLISSPMSNGTNGESHNNGSVMEHSGSPGKSVVTSKLGFPVRRLQETSKLSGASSPVHLRASEFWRKKETQVTGSPSPVGGAVTPNGHQQQKKYLNRIRSADSSPLPVPKMRKSPGGVVASNESISSLSSFSENAASPGPPKNCSSPITHPVSKQLQQHQGAVKSTPIRAHISKTPNPQQLTYGNNNKDKENNNTQQQSAVERLKVRIPSAPDGIKSSSGGTNPPTSSNASGNNKSESSANNPIRALIELNNGKTPGRNLEDALNELEDMYKSLRLSDEDLLDRAERRDLPTPHQELRDAPLIPIPQGYHRFEQLGSAESLGTGSGSGTNYPGSGGESQPQRVRAPSVRRSSRPDTVSDDMANRRLAFPDGRPLDPRVVVAKTGSYLARSPAFSPCTSPCPPEGASQQSKHLAFSLAFLGEEEPDVTLDDVSFRNYKRANSIRIIEPQPPFGIPLGPITAAPATDYLHSKPSESYRPIFGNLKTPDVVNDDIAFRNLRKDLGQEAGLTTAKDWTPRLFSPNRETSFNFPPVKDSKKLRAIRSLSANITHMLPYNSTNGGAARGSPTANLFQQHQQQQRYESSIGKWNSYGDLHRGANSPAGTPRASTYLQPSWVEQIEKVQTSTETLTDHRNSAGARSQLATAILDPPEHWERKFPKKTVELTPPIYDPDKPRRPWTDIILESFEKEKQKELERIAAEAEAAAAAAAEAANNKTEAKSSEHELVLEGDDDVFIDASEEASTKLEEEAKISGKSSKNNDPESLKGPNKDICSAAAVMLARPLPLLSGQKTRRGSWVEPSRSYSSSAAFHPSLYSPDTVQSSSSPVCAAAITSHHHEDKRRKSWSDLPKDIDSFSASTPEAIMLSGSSCSASPTRKLFNPLPPPKKIRQINLEAFNNNSNNNSSENQQQHAADDQGKSNLSSANGLNNVTIAQQFQQADQDNEDEENSLLTPSTDKVKSSSCAKFRQDDELNELMDQLLKDADACGQSVEEEKEAVENMKMNESRRIKGGDKDKSISVTPTKAATLTATPKEEMKMDGETSSSQQSCSKQDLSCTIVGMIPKQQSPPPPPASAVADRNNRKVELQQQQAPTDRDMEKDGDSGEARKVLKIDNSNEKGNVVVSVPKERNALSSSSSDPYPILEGKSRNKETSLRTRTSHAAGAQGGATAASSIEDLIESINETLPELEASCGVGASLGSSGMITSSSHSSDGKPNGSSSASGSPASSIPSPSPGSPTPPAVLSVSVVEKDGESETHVGGDDDRPLSPSSSAFPVAAKRHHLPGKGVVYSEESLYENLPAATVMMKMKQSKTGNDEKVCSSSPFPESEPYHLNKASKEKIPPLLTKSTSKREKAASGGGGRALHDSNNDEDEDNEEEDAQHSSSHQPSSLSSNDSSDVSGGGVGGDGESSSPRENLNERQSQDNANANNKIRDNNNEDQTCSSLSSPPPSSSLPSSLPFDASKTSSISPFDTTTFTNSQNNNHTTQTTTTTMTNRRMSGGNSNASSSTSSSRETLLRKKSEGSIPVHPTEQHDRSSGKCKASQQKSYPLQTATRESSLVNLSQRQQTQRGGVNHNNKNGVGRLGGQDTCPKTRETIIGNRNLGCATSSSSSSRSSSSPAEQIGVNKISHGKRKEQQQQPVARSKTCAGSAFPNQNHTQQTSTKKSATATTLAPSTAPTETSASETGNGGMSFLRNNFPFFRNSTSRSRSQSVISDVSRSSETGDSKKEKDKSYRRKSHLNRAFTDEPVPDTNYTYDATGGPKSSKPPSQDASSVENSAVEETRANHKPSVKLHPTIPSVLTSNKSDSNLAPNKSISRNNSYRENSESTPASPVPTNSHKSSPVVKKDSFSDAEGVSFIKKMLQKESDRDRAAAAAAAVGVAGIKQNSSQNGSCSTVNGNGYPAAGYNIKKSPSAGNQSYWSKFSSSQSAFLRKLFEKPKVSSESPVHLNNKTVEKTSSATNCTQSVEENCNGEQESSAEKENNAESVLGFSVAQKASFFMKLEHEQRFSKWRKNSVDLGIISSAASPPAYSSQTGENPPRLTTNCTRNSNEGKPKSRFLTRPVTPSEGSSMGIHCENLGRNNLEFGSLPRIWANNLQHLDSDSLEKINNETNNLSAIPTSSCTDYDDKHKFEPQQQTTKSMNKFNEVSTRNLEPISPYPIQPIPQAVKSYSLTRSSRHTGNAERGHHQGNHLASFPMYHSASAIINTTATTAPSLSAGGKHSSSSTKPSIKFYKNLGNACSSSSSSFSEAMSRQESTKYLHPTSVTITTKNSISNCGGDPPSVFENGTGGDSNDKRRGSASDLELSGAANQSPLMSRSDKVKSMFISRNSRYHCDTDNLSEDGEVSSGGQEVADIICRSYENSPVFRKKNWRTQKQVQSNFTKEIWRRCGNYENWSNNRSQPQPHRVPPQQHPVPQTFTATTNVIEVTTIPPTLPSVAASPPPATSNLLQILTVLSSSNDELNEPKPKSKKHHRQGGSREKVSGASSSRSDSIPPIHPNHHTTVVVQPRVITANCYNNSVTKNPSGPVSNNHRHTMPPTPTVADSDEIFVSVPHPEDEAFQSFFCSVNSYTKVSHYPPTNGVIVASSSCLNTNNGHHHQQQQSPQSYVAASVVSGDGIQREADEALDIASVRRESDLLVMKKNVPTCKRKSTGGKYKNPLRALAARMDFRQQGYTQTHSTNSNMVQCSSDVDVST